MAEFILKKGTKVTYQEKEYLIDSPISLEQVLLKSGTGDLILISDDDWQEAKR